MLTVLPFQLLHALTLFAGQPGPKTLVPLHLPHPTPKSLARTANLARNGTDGLPLRAVLGLMLKDQPYRPLPYLW
jgi:hypothetical protein